MTGKPGKPGKERSEEPGKQKERKSWESKKRSSGKPEKQKEMDDKFNNDDKFTNTEYSETEHDKDDKSVRIELSYDDIRSYFKNLREKYTDPGYDRPDFRYYMIIAFWIVMVAWWVFSFYIQMSRGNGSFLEGQVGFYLMLIERIGYGTCGAAALVWWWKKYTSRGHSISWWISLFCLAVALFLGLRNPIQDIPYLSHPETVVLQNCDTEYDSGYEYATYYKFMGKNPDGDDITFNTNKSTYYQIENPDEGTKFVVEYLPHTNMVMSIKEQ